MDKPNLTASEIGMLWTQYMQSTMSKQILKYFLETVEDKEISLAVKKTYDTTEQVEHNIRNIFEMEKIPVPDGFSESDVNVKAPKLFTDSLMLLFIEIMGKTGPMAYSLSLAASSRKDVRELFTNCISETSLIYNLSVETAQTKGVYMSPPSISTTRETEYIEGKKYIRGGLNPFNKRNLNTVEILHLFENIKTNFLGSMVCTGFAQTARTKEVIAYMKRGKEISEKHIDIFREILAQSDIGTPMAWDNGVTDSTIPVFSDKLLMFLLSVLSTSGQGNYSTASTASMRIDIMADYQRLALEVAGFAKDGIDIMLKHTWMEEPPQATNRKELMK